MKKIIILTCILSLISVIILNNKKVFTVIEKENIEALCNWGDDYNSSCTGPDGLMGYSMRYFSDYAETYVATYTGSRTFFNKTVSIKIGIKYKTQFSGYRCEEDPETPNACCMQSHQYVTTINHTEISGSIDVS